MPSSPSPISSGSDVISSQVRYGQIKRKLGLDNWAGGGAKAKDIKDEDGGSNSAPHTPVPARTKKAAATPGTGAGIKKRASTSKRAANATPGSRSRKTKSQAVIKTEDQELDDMEDDEMIDLTTPTKKSGSSQVKAELGGTGSGANNYIQPVEFADFPTILPDMVLERQAILVNSNGTWTISPATVDIHTQWLARLPARIQSQFYTQTSSTSSNGTGGNDNGGNKSGAGASNFILDDEDEASAQLIREHFEAMNAADTGLLAGTGLPMQMPMPLDMDFMNMEYLAPAANGNGSNNANVPDQAGNIDLHSIPMHPSYLQQLERDAREQEARDSDALFDNLGGYYGDC